MLILFLVFAAVAFFVISAIFTLIAYLFKIQNLSYKKSLTLLFSYGIINILVSYVVSFALIFSHQSSNIALSNILMGSVLFFPFYYLLKKHYQVTWKKSLGVYIVFGIIVNIIFKLYEAPVFGAWIIS